MTDTPTPAPAPMTSENGSCYPLQEVLRTAFPDLRFTTMQVMNMHLDLEQRFGQFIGHKSERDALTAARAAFDLSESERQRLAGRINALEAELETASKTLRKLRAMADEAIRALQTKDTTP